MSVPAFAQWDFSLSTDHSYDSNPFRLADAQASYVAGLDGRIAYNSNLLSISYNGSYNFFDRFSDRNYYWHQVALFHNFKSSEIGAFINQRINNPLYNVYDYSSYNLYATILYQAAGFNYRWYNQLSVDSYSQLSELNNVNFYTGMRVNKSYESATSVIFNSGLTYKKYTNQNIVTSTSSSSMGSGMQQGGHGWHDNDGMFAGPGSGQYLNLETPSVINLEWSLRLAQSVWKRAGLALQYNGSYNLSSQNRNVIGLTDVTESTIYDDPTGFNAQGIGVEFTWILPAGITWKSAYYYTSKNYINQGIYDSTDQYIESTARRDFRSSSWSHISRRFSLSKKIAFTPTLRFRWLDNHSNSYYYDYSMSSLNLSLNFDF